MHADQIYIRVLYLDVPLILLDPGNFTNIVCCVGGSRDISVVGDCGLPITVIDCDEMYMIIMMINKSLKPLPLTV